MEFKGSRTEANLWAAFAGESQARNKYHFYASVAKKEGYEEIAGIFLETADNEKEHAEIWYKLVHGLGSTLDLLREAAGGEHFEWSKMYREFAETAKSEGFEQISNLFDKVASIEASHEDRYLALAKNLEQNKVFAKDNPVKWQCSNCGYIHEGSSAPDTCPACAHPKAYFKVRTEGWR